MRLIFWGVAVVALCYVAYSGMIAAWSWIAMNNAVDEIISREGIEAVPVPEVKNRVLRAASEAGVPVGEQGVIVTREEHGVQVEVFWIIPVVTVRGESVVAVPLSVKRASAR